MANVFERLYTELGDSQSNQSCASCGSAVLDVPEKVS